MINTESIKSKLAKMLRLTKSSNEHEATNALHKFEELCREYGVTPTEITPDYDPERDEVIAFFYGKKFRKVDTSYNILINAVAAYFNGKVMITYEDRTFGSISCRKQLKIVATKGKQIQIELYSDYLLEVMDNLSWKAKEENPGSPPRYREYWKKGFAAEVRTRLKQKKKQQEKEGIPESHTEGIILMNKNARDLSAVIKFLNVNYTLRNRGVRYTMNGAGFQDGSTAGSSVGLNYQTEGTNHTHVLTGS
jgi:hypothetical protein